MNQMAKDMLNRLLTAGNKAQAGARSRAAALTSAQLKDYHQLRSVHEKQACESVLSAAQDLGAIRFIRDRHNQDDGLIERIELVDLQKLADFMGVQSHEQIIARASAILEPIRSDRTVINEVLAKWSAMGKARGTGPEDAGGWVDAVRVIKACQAMGNDEVQLSVRELSARLFKDSKRIERIAPEIDALLSDSIDAPVRVPHEVWQELGLLANEPPVLLAGLVEIRRQRVSALLDAPYAAFPAGAIQAVSSEVDGVLTIENLTTFHSQARKDCSTKTLIIYTAGMPSPTWCAMYERLLSSLPPDTPVAHWGDIDEGGFRIAAKISQVALKAGKRLAPYNMNPLQIAPGKGRQASESTINKMLVHAAAAGWSELAQAVETAGVTVEQESL